MDKTLVSSKIKSGFFVCFLLLKDQFSHITEYFFPLTSSGIKHDQ